MSSIFFHSENVPFKIKSKKKYKSWVRNIIQHEKKKLLSINFVFCSDVYLYKINQEYLNHDDFTDIITFPYHNSGPIEADIFISVERVKENAESYKVPFIKELHRVMAHGVLHLCGYGDKSNQERSTMRMKEGFCIELLSKIEE